MFVAWGDYLAKIQTKGLFPISNKTLFDGKLWFILLIIDKNLYII